MSPSNCMHVHHLEQFIAIRRAGAAITPPVSLQEHWRRLPPTSATVKGSVVNFILASATEATLFYQGERLKGGSALWFHGLSIDVRFPCACLWIFTSLIDFAFQAADALLRGIEGAAADADGLFAVHFMAEVRSQALLCRTRRIASVLPPLYVIDKSLDGEERSVDTTRCISK